jgi:hypothetical protein
MKQTFLIVFARHESNLSWVMHGEVGVYLAGDREARVDRYFKKQASYCLNVGQLGKLLAGHVLICRADVYAAWVLKEVEVDLP